MHAQLIDIEWLLSRHYFRPAKVQRQYIWNVSQCETFHNDLVDAFERDRENQYYLGPIILTKEEGKDLAIVYDGQQRLTTLTIYMAVLSRLTSGDSKTKTKELSSVRINEDNRARIDIRSRGGALTRVVNDTQTYGHSFNMPVDWRIYSIEKMFISRLEQLLNRDAFATWVLRNVVLNTLWAENDKGLTLFDRANNRGVKLEWYELVKSVLSEALGENFKAQETKSLGEFWYETERATGVEFSDLISCASFIRYGKMDSASALGEFEEEFDSSKKTFSTLEQSGTSLFESLASYKETSERLSNLCKWDPNKKVKIRDESELIEFQLLALEYPHWKSLLMFAENKVTTPDKKLKFLKDVRYLAYTAHLLGWPNWSGRLDNIYQKALTKLEHNFQLNGEVGFERLLFNPEQLAQAKGTLSSSMTEAITYRPLVKLWEAEQAFKNNCLIGNAHFLAQVEHILPQAPRNDWIKAFPDENERAELRNKLGNFCLLSKEDNYKLGNDDWATKRKLYMKAPKWFIGANSTAKQSIWSPDSIKSRTHELAQGIVEILGL